MKWIAPLCLLAFPAFAETCPPVADHSARLSQIVASLGAAKRQEEANILSQELWALWTDAPDERAQALLNEGMARRSNLPLRVLGKTDTKRTREGLATAPNELSTTFMISPSSFNKA